MRVAELMRTDVVTIDPEATVAELVQAMADSRVSGVPVVSSTGRVLGVVTVTDVLRAESEQGDSRDRTRLFEHTVVRDLMTPDAHTIELDADVRQAAQRMLYADVRRLFVEEQGRLVGVISATDVAQAVGAGRL